MNRVEVPEGRWLLKGQGVYRPVGRPPGVFIGTAAVLGPGTAEALEPLMSGDGLDDEVLEVSGLADRHVDVRGVATGRRDGDRELLADADAGDFDDLQRRQELSHHGIALLPLSSRAE